VEAKEEGVWGYVHHGYSSSVPGGNEYRRSGYINKESYFYVIRGREREHPLANSLFKNICALRENYQHLNSYSFNFR